MSGTEVPTKYELSDIEAELAQGNKVFIEMTLDARVGEKWVQLIEMRTLMADSDVETYFARCRIVDDFGDDRWIVLPVNVVLDSHQKAKEIPDLAQIMHQRREQKALWRQEFSDESASEDGMRQRIRSLTPSVLAWVCAQFNPQGLDSAQRNLICDFIRITHNISYIIECDPDDLDVVLHTLGLTDSYSDWTQKDFIRYSAHIQAMVAEKMHKVRESLISQGLDPDVLLQQVETGRKAEIALKGGVQSAAFKLGL